MTIKRIYWDSCIFIYLMSKHKEQWKIERQTTCKNCLQEAIDGKSEIYISTVSIVEFNRTTDTTFPIPDEIKEKITTLINQPFIKIVSADIARAFEARNHIWKWPWLSAIDAIHLASALYANVDELFTYDGNGSQKGLLDLDGLIGNPPLKIKHPHIEGFQPQMPISI
jgi:predicted nucleic acid-binding protein